MDNANQADLCRRSNPRTHSRLLSQSSNESNEIDAVLPLISELPTYARELPRPHEFVYSNAFAAENGHKKTGPLDVKLGEVVSGALSLIRRLAQSPEHISTLENVEYVEFLVTKSRDYTVGSLLPLTMSFVKPRFTKTVPLTIFGFVVTLSIIIFIQGLWQLVDVFPAIPVSTMQAPVFVPLQPPKSSPADLTLLAIDGTMGGAIPVCANSPTSAITVPVTIAVRTVAQARLETWVDHPSTHKDPKTVSPPLDPTTTARDIVSTALNYRLLLNVQLSRLRLNPQLFFVRALAFLGAHELS